MKTMIKNLAYLLILCAVLLLPACGQSRQQEIAEQLELGQKYLSEQNYEAAIVAFTRVIELDPKQTAPYLGRAEAYLQSADTEENLELALADYQAVTALDETILEAWQGCADIYIRQENYGEAITALTRVIDIDGKESSAHIRRASAYIRCGETEDNLAFALADYQAALELDESDAEAWLGIADIEIRRGEYEQALETLKEGLEKTGNDKTIAQKIREIESGSIVDASGKKREERCYGEEGELWYSIKFTYDTTGTLKEVTSYDSSGVQNGHADISYREDGKILKSYYFVSTLNGGIAPKDMEYDEAGNCIKQIEYSREDGVSVGTTHINSYDDAGNKIREELYGSSGELWRIYEFEYDESGKVVKRTRYEPDGEMKNYEIYEYDSMGNKIKDILYRADGTMTDYDIYEYDQNGNSLGYRHYNGEGNLISSTIKE